MLTYSKMLQRRGNFSDLSKITLDTGEIGIVLDLNGMIFYGVNGQNRLILDANSVIDSLDVNQSNLPLSAKQGLILKGKVDSAENLISAYRNETQIRVEAMEDGVQQNTNDIVSINISLNDLQMLINQKQDIVVHKGLNPPSDTSLIWDDTNI